MKRVFVGMSGGVDSSVTAKRLLQAGYEVVGVFIKVWQPEFIHCEWEKERLDAMRVAAHLGIPFLTMDAEAVYKKEVADYMIRAYKEGLTPNPDVMCNEHVKFGAFFTWARSQGADFIATGHYAQIKKQGDTYTLCTAQDATKDQSYFLAGIHADVLPSVLFPIGDTLKEDVRKEAEAAGLPTATKADSQGICFLGHIDIPEFLSHFIDVQPGSVIDTEGTILGEHKGAIFYTLGQRQGFTVFEKGTTSEPFYVIARNIEKNTLTVAHEPPHMKKSDEIQLRNVNILGTGLKDSMDAVFRYHGPRERVHVESGKGGSVILRTENSSIQTPAAGQMCVLYNDDECCGGGIIF